MKLNNYHASLREVNNKKELVLFDSYITVSYLQYYHGKFSLCYKCKNTEKLLYIHLSNINHVLDYIKKSEIIFYYYQIPGEDDVLCQIHYFQFTDDIPTLLIHDSNHLEMVEYI